MARSAALLYLPTRKPDDGRTDTVQESASLVMQGLEDLQLAERVARALCATGYVALRGVEVVGHMQVVTFNGLVPSYYLEQIAQVIALAVPVVRQLQNNLEVVELS